MIGAARLRGVVGAPDHAPRARDRAGAGTGPARAAGRWERLLDLLLHTTGSPADANWSACGGWRF